MLFLVEITVMGKSVRSVYARELYALFHVKNTESGLVKSYNINDFRALCVKETVKYVEFDSDSNGTRIITTLTPELYRLSKYIDYICEYEITPNEKQFVPPFSNFFVSPDGVGVTGYLDGNYIYCSVLDLIIDYPIKISSKGYFYLPSYGNVHKYKCSNVALLAKMRVLGE